MAQPTAPNQAFADVIGFYQRYISGIRPDECPMYPSCSQYGLAQFRTHGAIPALLNTSDRLLRCGHDHRRYAYYVRTTPGVATPGRSDASVATPGVATPAAKLLDTGDERNDARLAFRFARRWFAATDTTSPSAAIRFVQHLLNQQLYEQALLEIERLRFAGNVVTGAEQKLLYLNYIRALKGKGEYEKIIYEHEVGFPKAIATDPDVLFAISQTWLLLGNFANAGNVVEQARLAGAGQPGFADKTALLSSLIQARQFNWAGSRQALNGIAPGSAAHNAAQAVRNVVDRAAAERPKKPALAGALAVVPGAGYWYAGHRQTALSALLLNSLLMFATYTTVRQENYGLAGLTGAFTLAFYVGNIRGSVKSARRYNQQRRQAAATAVERLVQFY